MITGEALQDGYRKRVTLATKSPIWNIRAHNDFEKYLDEELKGLRTNYIDMYQLLNKPVNDSLMYQNSRMVCADQCIKCGHCKQHCPQQLEIPELMKIVHRELMRQES
jgi:predicted aldo/keto reductase-like oxidoreductase